MTDWRLQRVTAPASSPVTLDEVKAQLRIDGDAEDDLLQRYIDAATDAIEGPHGIGVLLESQQWNFYQDAFTRVIRIPLFPVISVDEIAYVDETGTEQILDPSMYRTDTVSNPARINAANGQTWPPTLNREPNAVRIKFTGGYESVPEALRAAIILWVAHMYEIRQPVVVGSVQAEIPFTIEELLGRYRVPGIG